MVARGFRAQNQEMGVRARVDVAGFVKGERVDEWWGGQPGDSCSASRSKKLGSDRMALTEGGRGT